jgi:GTPase involved in cell partitioning and DNA repair
MNELQILRVDITTPTAKLIEKPKSLMINKADLEETRSNYKNRFQALKVSFTYKEVEYEDEINN